MKLFSKAPYKSLALAAVVATIFAAPAVKASCWSDCDQKARTYAEQARTGIRSGAASKCASAPDQQACIAAEYAYAEQMYTYVYNSAYASCTNSACRYY